MKCVRTVKTSLLSLSTNAKVANYDADLVPYTRGLHVCVLLAHVHIILHVL